MRTLALELGSYNIRVNTVNPSSVDTALVHNALTYALFAPDLSEDERTRDMIQPRFQAMHVSPVALIEPSGIVDAGALAGIGRGQIRHDYHAAGGRGEPVALSVDAAAGPVDGRPARCRVRVCASVPG
jgi:hypothetical protein